MRCGVQPPHKRTRGLRRRTQRRRRRRAAPARWLRRRPRTAAAAASTPTTAGRSSWASWSAWSPRCSSSSSPGAACAPRYLPPFRIPDGRSGRAALLIRCLVLLARPASRPAVASSIHLPCPCAVCAAVDGCTTLQRARTIDKINLHVRLVGHMYGERVNSDLR